MFILNKKLYSVFTCVVIQNILNTSSKTPLTSFSCINEICADRIVQQCTNKPLTFIPCLVNTYLLPSVQHT